MGYKNMEVMKSAWATGRRGAEGESSYMPGSQPLACGQGLPSSIIPVGFSSSNLHFSEFSETHSLSRPILGKKPGDLVRC